MKKTMIFITLLAVTLNANAQGIYYPLTDKGTFEEILRSVVILLLIYLVTNFILNMIKIFLDNRLKSKMVESGTPQDVVVQLIPAGKNEKNSSIKWFCVLSSIAIGLGIIGLYQPVPIYSVMIMTFSLAIGFLGYFFLIKRLHS